MALVWLEIIRQKNNIVIIYENIYFINKTAYSVDCKFYTI